MQDRTINNALLALRKQIIQEDGEGRDQVETLLALRDVNLPHVVIGPARRGVMRKMLLNALRNGPRPRCDLVAIVAASRPEVPPQLLYWRVDSTLGKMQAAGMVKREGRFWRLGR